MNTRKRPVAGIGYGQKGFWGNKHFSTLALAEAAYERHAKELRNEVAPSGTGGRLCWTHGAIETPIVPTPGSSLVKGARFVGKLKSGKPGKTVHTILLYMIDDAMAEKFLQDPWYCVSA